MLNCHWSVVSPVPDYVKATVETVLKIHETEEDGDVLAFLTGQVSDQVLTNIKSLFIFLGFDWQKGQTCIDNSVLCVYFIVLLCGLIFFCLLFYLSSYCCGLRKRWRRWCPSCRTRPGLCHDMAWRNTWEFCPCTPVSHMLSRWRSSRGRPPLFAR